MMKKQDVYSSLNLHVSVVKVWRRRSIFSFILALSLRFQKDRPVNIDSGAFVSPEPSIAATSGPSLLLYERRIAYCTRPYVPSASVGKIIHLGIVILRRAAQHMEPSHVSLPP